MLRQRPTKPASSIPSEPVAASTTAMDNNDRDHDPSQALLASDRYPLSGPHPSYSSTLTEQDIAHESAEDMDLSKKSRKAQWIILAVASGACAAFNGVFAKLYVYCLFPTQTVPPLYRQSGFDMGLTFRLFYTFFYGFGGFLTKTSDVIYSCRCETPLKGCSLPRTCPRTGGPNGRCANVTARESLTDGVTNRTTTELTTSFATWLANLVGLEDGEKVVEYVIRAVSIPPL